MSSIGGPGGIGGPKGPTGPGGPDAPDAPDGPDGIDAGAGEVHSGGPVDRTTAAARAAPTDIDAISAELAAGRLTPHEAIERLVDQIAGTEQLDPADRSELRELLSDLVANDPHLAALAGRV